MEGEGDDQGSGWLEVKKKHRTSSKLLNQKVSGESFSKRKTYSPPLQASKIDEVGDLHRRQVEITKDRVSIAAHSEASFDSSCLIVADSGCLEKVVSIEENETPQLKVASPEGDSRTVPEILIKQNVDIVPKIKWGDLEDVALLISEGCGTSAKIVSDVIDGSVDIMQEHTDIAQSTEPVRDATPCSPLQLKVTLQDSRVYNTKPTDGTRKEVSHIASGELVEDDNPTDADEIKNTQDNSSGRTTKTEPGGDFCPSDSTVKDCSSSPILLGKPPDKSKEASVPNEMAGLSDGLGDANLVPNIDDGHQNSVDEIIKEATENPKDVQDVLTAGVDIAECEQGESKERFRERLWCFLFENLNRAVDELYLLCELECDMAQMNEAMLVLEEAASDFKDLKCRVEHFENTKRSASQQSKDEVQVNMKTDHRRPHALSWEVRRMTTSPHRAEILSSSLEAFKKIQLERGSMHASQDTKDLSNSLSSTHRSPKNSLRVTSKIREPKTNSEKQRGAIGAVQVNTKVEKLTVDTLRQNRVGLIPSVCMPVQNQSTSVANSRREPLEPIKGDKQEKSMDKVKIQIPIADKEKEKEKEKRIIAPWKPMDAWKEKRNWEDILKSPMRTSTRVSHSPGLARRGVERGRVLHDKLMSPEKKKKTALDLKRDAEEKHARAMRIRSQLENERVQKLQRTSEKLNRVNEWQAVRSMKLREGMYARHQRSESRHEAYLAQVARRAGDESSKVNEVRFITSLNEENKKLILRQKLHDSKMRRAEKLQVIRSKQKEDTAREEAVLERRKLLEAEKLNRLAETQRKKEEAQVRREEERKASSAAREAKALEQLRKKADRARAQQEEAELLAQKLAERLSESEQRRKSYLEQIREKASMDFRDQSSPLLRRSLIKEGPSRFNSVEDFQSSCISSSGDSALGIVNNATRQQSLKRRIKKIRQRLMALKHEFSEPLVGGEGSGIGYRALVGTAREKIGRWLQDLQRLRQARKEGAASIGLIIGEMVKFLEGKDLELHASRQAGLLDFISSALPASHTSKPEACKVTVYLLRLLRVVLSVHANRCYFLVQNLLPPIIPMLSASLENYIKIAASSSTGSSSVLTSKASTENLEAIAEILDGFLWTVTMILGHACSDEQQLQMQNGLMELIVSYQIIHRLRDLFALYDRPQIEGSPFPTSILLSLDLLAVLTSRSKTISSIDWEACISISESKNKVEETKSLESQDIRDSSVITISSEHIEADLPDNRPLHSEYTKNPSLKSDGQCNGDGVKCSKTIADAKSVSPSKDGKSIINGCSEAKRCDEQILQGNNESKKESRLRQPIVFLLSSIAETGLVGLPSLLTAVLLQANNRLSSEQASYILPSNFEEVATGVLKVLNNLALLDIALLQIILARPDLKMELFHLMSFLLSYCTSKWKAANDQVGLLLLESLLLLGYFALFHPGNQAVLRWGKSPTILHKVCDLPFVFFSDPELTPILASTLVAACYGCDQNRGLLLQELSIDMLLSLIKSCRQGLLAAQSEISETALKPNRKVSKANVGKGGNSGSNAKASKTKILRDNRGTRTCDEWALKHSLPSSETCHTFMLHQRFPTTFLDKAEEFFTSESLDMQFK